MKKILCCAFLILLSTTTLSAQVEGNVDDLFNNPDDQVVQEAKTIENPAEQNDKPGLVWGGEFISILGLYAGWTDLLPANEDWLNVNDGLHVQLTGKLYFDARPNKNFRVFGKFTTDYPFYTTVGTSPSTWNLNNIKIFELFSDFNINQLIFIRFGKQTAHWGLSWFYQVADPLSVAVKDPEKPTNDLEGPLALKVTIPFGLHNLYLYTVAKDSYLPANMLGTTFRDLGYGLKTDLFLPIPKNPVMSSAELTMGTFYQRNLAPKLVMGISTGIWQFDVFSDQIFSLGQDNYRLTSNQAIPSSPFGTVYESVKDTDGLFYAMTAGIKYVNTDWNMTVYGEYMFNAAGSVDPDYMSKLYTRYQAELASLTTNKTLSSSSLLYPSMHNFGLSVLFSQLFGNDKLAASVFWQANWNDLSGLIVPSLTFAFNDYVKLTAGARLFYGKDGTEFIIKSMSLSSLTPQRLTLYFDLSLGSGKF